MVLFGLVSLVVVINGEQPLILPIIERVTALKIVPSNVVIIDVCVTHQFIVAIRIVYFYRHLMMRLLIEEVLLGEGRHLDILIPPRLLVHLPVGVLALALLVAPVFLLPVGPLGRLMGNLLLSLADLLVAFLSLLLQLALDLVLAL